MEINSFFRTESSDHQGIVYQVIKENEDNYTCIGSRSIGIVDGKIIWELGGYVDDIPIKAMHDVSNPIPMTTQQTNKFVKKNKLDKKYELMNLYSDEYGYWFKAKQKSINRQTNRSRPRTNRSGSRTNRSRPNRSTNRSRTRPNRSTNRSRSKTNRSRSRSNR
jgi:hypothetical protein